MKLDEYQAFARETAIYPGELVYPTLGLCGEIGELLSVIGDEIPKEIGDVLWYVANVAADASLTLSEVMGRKTFPNHNLINTLNDYHVIDAIVLVLAGGVVAENVKKTLRDDEGVLCDRRRTNIKKALKIIVRELNLLCWNTRDRVQLVRCAKDNIAKLQSRQERGKLGGDGDNR